MEDLEVLLSNGCGVNQSDSKGDTPLITAVKNENETVVKYLCSIHADINQPSKNGETPLYIACERMNRKIVKILLDAGSDVFTTTNNLHPQTGSSPLMAALPSFYEMHVKKKCKSESLHIVKLLLSYNCDINAQNWAGNTALHIAADRNDLQTICLLCEHGANLHIRNNFGLTAFEEALKPNIQRYDVASILLIYGYDIETIKPEVHPLISIIKGIGEDKSKYFPISKFTRKTLLEIILYVVHSNAELKQEIFGFLTHKTDIEPFDKYFLEQFLVMENPRRLQELCRSVIRRAISRNILQGIRYLPIAKGLKKYIAFNVDINRNDPLKTFELITAILENDEEKVKQMTASGIDLNVSMSSNTALTRAAKKGNSAICALLVDNGAEVDLYDNTGKTALHVASSNGQNYIVELLLRYGASVNKTCRYGEGNSVTLAAENGHFTTMNYLLVNGGNPNVPTSDGRYVFHIAAASGYFSAIKTLLGYGIDTETRDSDQNTPLHIAASRGLLYSKDKIKSQDNSVHVNYNKCVQILLNAGANKFVSNHFNKTPSEVAVHYSHNDIALLLK